MFAQPALGPDASETPRGLAGMQAEVVLKGRGGAERLRAQEAMHLLHTPNSVSPQRQLLPLLRRRLLCVRRHVPVQHGALDEAAGAVRAGEDGQRQVGEGVPQQGAQRELREVTHAADQALGAHVAQQVVFDRL